MASPRDTRPSMPILSAQAAGSGSAGLAGYRMATEELWLRQQPSASAPQHDYLSFLVGDEVYAVEIERIREIIKVRPVTEVPHAPPFVIGVIAVRGVVLPVLDLRLRLRLPSAGLGRSARFLVVRRDEELFGLLVDEVRQVVRLSEADIEPPPPMLAGSEAKQVEAQVATIRARLDATSGNTVVV